MSDAIQLLQQLAAANFYGSLEVKFEAGKITLLRKIETMLPKDSHQRRNRLGDNDR